MDNFDIVDIYNEYKEKTGITKIRHKDIIENGEYTIGVQAIIINSKEEIQSVYKETKNQDIFKYSNNRKKDRKVEQNYYKYTEKIYKYLIENYVTLPPIIEGRHIFEYIKADYIKGTIIIKRTSLFHSYKRAFNRDVLRSWKMYKNNEIKMKDVREKFFSRIKLPLEDYRKINKFIEKVIAIRGEENVQTRIKISAIR